METRELGENSNRCTIQSGAQQQIGTNTMRNGNKPQQYPRNIGIVPAGLQYAYLDLGKILGVLYFILRRIREKDFPNHSDQEVGQKIDSRMLHCCNRGQISKKERQSGQRELKEMREVYNSSLLSLYKKMNVASEVHDIGLSVCCLLYKEPQKFCNSKRMTSLQDFNNLITRMLFPENEARKEAEKQYDQIELLPKTQMLFQLFMDQNAGIE
ncbi:unnamed protein product, partial [Onchocerca flexuosa]|uniref:Uncharacterized protein n=1 Tax=Onchocerca flexuosa TaxID=387005 RepID=A0A183I616_9BILA